MTRLTILADDLTGAADCAVQAIRAGLTAQVRFADASGDADVVAHDLDVRNAGPEAAAAALRAAAPPAGTYLKIDSTLRGPIAAMVDAALDAGGARVAVVAPAFPALGRRTRDGRHRTDDGAVDLDLADVVGGDRPVVPVRPGATVDAPDGAVFCCDAETDEDLARIAADLAELRPLWVGSAGLAAALLGGVGEKEAPGAPFAPTADRPVLTVAGSFAAETAAQLDRLLVEGDVRAVPVDPGRLANEEPGAVLDAAAAISSAITAGLHPVLHVATDEEARHSLRGAGGAHVRGRSVRIAASLGRIVAGSDLPAGAGLVLTGGETARAVCDALGVPGLALHGEVAPGVPHGQALDADLRLVTKAGAFGAPDVLLHALRHLQGSP